MSGSWTRPASLDDMRLAKLVRKVGSLGAGDRLALLPATARLIAARAALRLLPFRVVLRWAEAPVGSPIPQGSPIAPPILRRLRALERAAHGLFPRDPCLTQAVVAHRLLRKQGFPSELRIGVRRTRDVSLEAHAWVECEGRVVIGERGLREDHAVLSRKPHSPRGGGSLDP